VSPAYVTIHLITLVPVIIATVATTFALGSIGLIGLPVGMAMVWCRWASWRHTRYAFERGFLFVDSAGSVSARVLAVVMSALAVAMSISLYRLHRPDR